MLPRELKYFYEKSSQESSKPKRKTPVKPNLVAKKSKKSKKVDFDKLVEVLIS
jgi:hypothetical protein